jgi:hypothetical protein
VTAVTKEKTALVIPNAIQINTDSDKHFFCSFGARDKTYVVLFRTWQQALLDQVIRRRFRSGIFFFLLAFRELRPKKSQEIRRRVLPSSGRRVNSA